MRYQNIIKKSKREIIKDIKETIETINSTDEKDLRRDEYITSLNLSILYKNGEMRFYNCEDIAYVENLNERDIESIIFSDWDDFMVNKSLKNYEITVVDEEDVDNKILFKNTVVFMEFR